jgi:hypothetical protein
MSLEFYCRWGSTVEFLYIKKKYLKNLGFYVVGVLLYLEFFCLQLSLEFYGQHRKLLYLFKKDGAKLDIGSV